MFDDIINNFRKSSEEQKNKATFGIWIVIYIFVFSISLIFNFSINLAMGVSCILAGLYSIFTGYAFINHTIVFSLFSMFHTRTLGRVVGLIFVIFGFFILSSESEFMDESAKAFFVIYPAALVSIVFSGLLFLAKKTLHGEGRKNLSEEEVTALERGLPLMQAMRRFSLWALGIGIILAVFSFLVYG